MTYLAYQQFAYNYFSRSQRSYFKYYPDIIPYDYTKLEFQRIYSELLNSKTDYFMVTDYQIRPVSFKRYAWEHIRGAFGFNNRCQAAKVGMSLQKFFYYGYVHSHLDNIPTPEMGLLKIELFKSYAIDFFKKSHYQNENMTKEQVIATLQQDLISDYIRSQKKLRPSLWNRLFSRKSIFPNPSNANYVFGDTIMALVDFKKVKASKNTEQYRKDCIAINLQLLGNAYPTTRFIEKYSDFIVRYSPPEKIIAITDSSFAKTIAHKLIVWINLYLLNDKKITLANGWQLWERYAFAAKRLDNTIQQGFLAHFIDYYIYKANYETAFDLILQLPDINRQFLYITNSLDHFTRYFDKITRDSPLAIELANDFKKKLLAIELANDVKKRLANPRLTDEKTKSKLEKTKSKLRQDIKILISTYSDPEFFMNAYVSENNYHAAYQHYLTYHEQLDRKKISDSLSQLIEHLQITTKGYQVTARQLHQIQPKEACTNYKLNIQGNKKLIRLLPADDQAADIAKAAYIEKIAIYRGLKAHAFTLYKYDKTKPSPTRTEILDKAIDKFKKSYEIMYENQDRLKGLDKSYAEVLAERTQIALNQCLDDTSEGAVCSDEHKTKCKAHIDVANAHLQIIIKLMQRLQQLPDITKAQRKEYQLAQAKYCFILGDLQQYFELPGNPKEHPGNAEEYLEKATQLAENNPFYLLRYAEIMEDKQMQKKAVSLFADQYNGRVNLYHQWKDERWQVTKMESKDIDIHHIPETKKAFSLKRHK